MPLDRLKKPSGFTHPRVCSVKVNKILNACIPTLRLRQGESLWNGQYF